jgi:hypothetical protein
MILRQKIWLSIVIAANLALWLIPSDVVEEIARQRHVMLGRYSRTHFTWIVVVLVISLISFYIDWSTGPTYRRRWFQVMATVLFLLPSLVALDFVVRTPDVEHYVRDRVAFHRPPNARFAGTYADKPETHRSYPNAPPGYPDVAATLTTDHRGYRNQTNLEQYDVVVLGDSFAEGSKVSDDHAWPALLAARSGMSVYNLGMSSYDPLHYLESLRDTGLALKPRLVLCMLYEGNDFRSTKSDEKRKSPSISKRVEDYLDRSPVIKTLDRLLIDTFGPINSAAELRDASRIDWLPLAIPQGVNARYYAFEPKQLRDLYGSRDDFAADKHWLNPRSQLAAMNELCRGAEAQLLVILAPTKAHVTFPVAAKGLDSAKVRAFTAISYKEELPAPDVFLEDLVHNVDAREQVVGEWCQRQSIGFLGLTNALRRAAVAGTQVYFTYDQHWTPAGHDVVAETIHHVLLLRPSTDLPTAPQAPPGQG